MAWSRRLPKILVLKDGRELKTLADARALITEKPERRRDNPHWEYADKLLTVAIQDGGIRYAAFTSQLKRALKAEGLI
jgi:hypothetical protein